MRLIRPGTGKPKGEVVDVHEDEATIKSKRGNDIKKSALVRRSANPGADPLTEGDEDDPAVEIKQSVSPILAALRN